SISGLNQTLDFGTITKAEIAATKQWTGIKFVTPKVVVTGCGAGLSSIELTPTYSHGTQSDDLSLGKGVSGVTGFVLKPGENAVSSAALWNSGAKRAFPLKNGGATVEWKIAVAPNGQSVSVGALSGTVSLVLDTI
ncbi:TPA: hypothetical protein NZJ50_004676, partial [Salmonella enterica subsp. enterica serovar Ruiru]|nr:hypothetical protein [Salmonella enterica subsp. enterica serovar Ruiru]